MNTLRRGARDPWWDDGTGVRRARTRRKVTSMAALGCAIVACGLTVAAWIHAVAPMASPLSFF